MVFFPVPVESQFTFLDYKSGYTGNRVNVQIGENGEGVIRTLPPILGDDAPGIPIEVIQPIGTEGRLNPGLREVDGMGSMNDEYPYRSSPTIEFFLERADVQIKAESDQRSEGSPSKEEGSRPIPSAADGNWQIGEPNPDLKAAIENFEPGRLVDISGGYTGKTSELPLTTFNPGADIPTAWRFISAPMEVSWSKSGEMSMSESYATNEPFAIYSQTSMRVLTLGDCLVEGFSLGKTVDKVIEKLETMMRIVFNPSGFASPYVWRLVAGTRDYGLYVIKELDIKEELRDKSGKTTRARVSISLVEVPKYQVSDGRDLAREEDLVTPSPEVEKLLEPKNETGDGSTPGDSGGKVLSSSQGLATYYNTGTVTASGAKFDKNAMTAASNSLPFGTVVRVTNLDTGASVTVTITDNGGFTNPGKVSEARLIDLSEGAFKKIAPLSAGKIRVRQDVIKLGTQRNPNMGKDGNRT